jgi:hypothetical protein
VKYVHRVRHPSRARGERHRAARCEDVVRDARAMRLPSRTRVERRGDDARRRERCENGRQGADEESSTERDARGAGEGVDATRETREKAYTRPCAKQRVWIAARRDEDASRARVDDGDVCVEGVGD